MAEQGQGTEVASFARARNPDSETVQVSFNCPKETLMWLDAVSTAGQRDRGPLINEILQAWAEKEAHKHMVVQRIVGSNLTGSESGQGARA